MKKLFGNIAKFGPIFRLADTANAALYEKYKELADKESKVRFGGRLGTYHYMDMDQVIKQALTDAEA